MKIILFCFLSLTSLQSYSNSEIKIIPFVFNSSIILNSQQVSKYFEKNNSSVFAHQGDKVLVSSTSSINVEASKIGELVGTIRNEVCSGIKKGNFKVWLKFDANAKVLGIGTSSEGGIEVNIEC